MAKQDSGIISCCRYAYPPNSLSLCGPIGEKDNLKYYSTKKIWDKGTKEILTSFATLTPYLRLIANENSIGDPFDKRVVEAYWLGNSLLSKISKKSLAVHLTEKLSLKKKLEYRQLNKILDKLRHETVPLHAFHVMNIYKRTGHLDTVQTIETMDACIINWGIVIENNPSEIRIKTQRLARNENKLIWEFNIERTVKTQGIKDLESEKVKPGDYISYHWGYFCEKISKKQLINLQYFTGLSLKSANLN